MRHHCGKHASQPFPQRVRGRAPAAIPCKDVLYMGVPYHNAKYIDGLWCRESAEGVYRPFALQSRVRVILGSAA